MNTLATIPRMGKELLQNIDDIEGKMMREPQVSCDVIHRFGPGQYIREVNIPAGTFAIGHHQNFEHMNIFLKGRVTILNDDGSMSELKAPMIFVGKPGRKIGYIHEDMVWLNVYATEERDVERLEAHFITKSEEWGKSVAAIESIKALQGTVTSGKDSSMLAERSPFDMGEENMTDLPFGSYKIKIGDSRVHGKGLFATSKIEPFEFIAPAQTSGKQTIAYRYANHSLSPNAQLVPGSGTDLDLMAVREIGGCRGGLDGEEITINYRDAFKLKLEIGGEQCQL